MDDRRFDHLTRTLARATTRRGALKAMLGGLAAGVAAMRREPAAAQDGLRLDILACLGLTPHLAAQVCVALNLPHVARTGCVNGRCAILACQPGWADCDGQVRTGCETPLGSREHCAACGDGCARLDDTCNVGACAGGSCVAQPANEGGSCDDGNACTRTDTCRNGVCAGGNPVVCTALSPCHDIGVCDPATGQCSNPPKPEGANCDGGSCCNGECVDTQTSLEHCGACDNACRLEPTSGSCEDVPICRAGACSFTPLAAGTVCRPAAGACDVAEVCDGTALACPPDTVQPAGVACRPSVGICDIEDVCTGTSPHCPPDTYAPPTQVCRHAAGACDPAEFCPGDGPLCPANALSPAGTVCRPGTCAAGVATPPTFCPGTSATCPASPPNQNCFPYTCNDAGTECRSTCTSDAHCVASHHCAGGQCLPD